MTTVLSKLMLLGMAPVLLIDSVGFFGWEMVVSFDNASGDNSGATVAAAPAPDSSEGAASVSSFVASLLLLPTPLALSPAELSVLEVILVALGWDKSLAAPLLTAGSVESVGSGATKGFFRMLPSTIGGLVPSLPLLWIDVEDESL
jgi:hypothetical protein